MTVCPIQTLQSYKEFTKDTRGDLTGLFLITTKPYRKGSKVTLSRRVKEMLKGACIGMKSFSLHSTRSASTSMAKSAHLPPHIILKTESWRSMELYTRRYDKPIQEIHTNNIT